LSPASNSKYNVSNKLSLFVFSLGLGLIALSMMMMFSGEKNIPEYKGYADALFLDFIWKHQEKIFHLDLTFDEEESSKLFAWSNVLDKEVPPWMGVHQLEGVDVPLGEPLGMEFRFQNSDGDLYLNTRYPGKVRVFGYFKVHGISGPNQGFYSVILRSVAKESI